MKIKNFLPVFVLLCSAAVSNAQNLDLYLDGFGPLDCALRSAVLPGWGQIHRGSKTKGFIIMGAEVLSAGSSYFFYRKAKNNYDKYKHEGIRDSKLYDKYENNLEKSRVAGISCAVIWMYSVFEAYFGAEKVSNISLNADLEGVEIRFTKRFDTRF